MEAIANAMNTIREEMRKDPEYYNVWKANIAMAFYDEFLKVKQESVFITNRAGYVMANKAAEDFLYNLIHV